jgi:hypothetical protein
MTAFRMSKATSIWASLALVLALAVAAAARAGDFYTQTNLVSDQSSKANHLDSEGPSPCVCAGLGKRLAEVRP